MIEIKKPLLPIAVIILGITSLLVGGRFPYLFFYLAALLFVIPFLWLRFCLGKLKGSIEVSQEYGEVGKNLTVSYRVINSPSGRFPYLELTNIIGSSFNLPPEDRLVTLEPGDSDLYRCEVRCPRRGKYDLKAFRVKTGDPFGFFKLSRSLSTGKEIKIYPKKKFYPQFALPDRQHFGSLAVHNMHMENYAQVSDLRDWRQGDSAKKIHWKQSARQGKLVVKNYDNYGDASVNIFIDMNRNNYRHDRNHILEDLAVEAAASLIYVCLKEKAPLQVFSEPLGEGFLHGSLLRDYRAIMDRLITLAPSGRRAFASYVNNCIYYLPPKSSIHLFAPRLHAAEGLLLLNLKQKGFSPHFFYLSVTEPAGEEKFMLDKLEDAGIKTYNLHPEEAEEYAG